MANVCIVVKVGKINSIFECGREYNFSIGEEGSKIRSEDILNLVEEAMEQKIEDKYGLIKEKR